MSVVDRVRELIAPIVEDAGADLYDIEFAGGILRILIDHEDGIGIDDIKRISRTTSHMLDEVDPIPGRFTLEVSSPGLERPLRTEDHYQRAIGEKVKIKTFNEIDGARRFEGKVVTVDADGVDLSTRSGSRRFAYTDISKARTVFEWGPTPKLGGPKKNRPNSEEAMS